jgi:hypothetical protein
MVSWRHAMWSILGVGLVPVGAVADVDSLLDKVATTYGGRERLAQVTVFQQFGVTQATADDRRGPVQRAYQHPDRLYIKIAYAGRAPEIRVLAGAHGWRDGRPVAGPFYDSMLLQAARLGLPNTLFEHRAQLKDAGSVTGRRGETLRALELRFHGNLKLIVGIDPQTGHIRESNGVLARGGAAMEFGATYDDFRRVGGRLFAFHETHYAGGAKTGETQLERIELMRELPPSLFDAPPKPAAPARPDVEARGRAGAAPG